MRPISILFIASFISLNQSFGQIKSPAVDTIKPPLSTESDLIPDYHKLNWCVIENEPTFKNGPGAWQKYLIENLNSDAIENECPPGRYKVRIQFVVKQNGELDIIKALTNYGFGMEAEAIRVICASPKWIPATRNGRNIMYGHIISIIFEVCEEADTDPSEIMFY